MHNIICTVYTHIVTKWEATRDILYISTYITYKLWLWLWLSGYAVYMLGLYI